MPISSVTSMVMIRSQSLVSKNMAGTIGLNRNLQQGKCSAERRIAQASHIACGVFASEVLADVSSCPTINRDEGE